MRIPAPALMTLLLAALLGGGEGTPPTLPAEATPTPPVAAAPRAGTVAVIRLHEEIDARRAKYLERAYAEARAAKATAVVLHIETDGGEVGAARDMVDTVLRAAQDETWKPLTVAFIDGRAYSAGALIAYSHRQVWLTEPSSIGDIGVIMVTRDPETGAPKIEYAPEKFETVIRTLLRKCASINGWDAAKLQKMTARNQELYRFTLPDGSRRFVLEDDLGRWLAEHPDVDPKDKVLISGKDRLLTYHGKEAIDEGMATGMCRDLADCIARLGYVPEQVARIQPTRTEEISWALAPYASMLAGLAVLFLFLEMKTPGVGIWAVLAGVCGVGFFLCQYYAEMAAYPEIIAVLLGIALVALEFFLLPTGGALAGMGLLLGLGGLIWAFMPDSIQWSPSAEGWSGALGSALRDSILALVMIAVGALVFIRVLPNSRFMRRLAVTSEISGTSASAEDAAATLIGRRARCRTDLHPAGFVEVDGREVSAQATEGRWIAAGTVVEIVDQRLGEVIVQAAADATP